MKRPDGGAQWVLRLTFMGKRREMGLGALKDVSLAGARRQAAIWRSVAAEGKDPLIERNRRRALEARIRPSFEEAFLEAFEARKAQLKRDGAAGRWDSPIRVHVLPKIGETEIEDIDQETLRAVLAPIWHEKPEVARKALNRIRIIMRHAAALGLNVDLQAPDKAKALLGAQRHEVRRIPSMNWRDVPEFYQSLDGNSLSELALRLLILTAARSSEIRFLQLDEIDKDIWTIPAERMKSGREHRIPLSEEALSVIDAARPFARGKTLFPGKGKGVISDMTMTALMRRRALEERPHGFRSSFRTWCAEATDTPREIAETCLAHKSASDVEAAYRRTDYLDARRDLMARWADYICGVG